MRRSTATGRAWRRSKGPFLPTVFGRSWALVSSSLLMLALIAWTDSRFAYLTGIRFLYVLPVWLLARRGGTPAGVFVAFAASGAMAVGDRLISNVELDEAMLNGVTGFFALVLIAFIIANVEQRLRSARLLAIRDPLTGVLNRSEMQSRVESAIERIRFGGPCLAFAYVDCDRFKEVNDTRGHAFGDRVLRVLARGLRSAVNDQGIVGRMGGDEFVVLFEGVSEEHARERMEIAKRSFGRHMSRLGNDTTLSFGVIPVGDEPATFRDLLEAADREMYRRKRGFARAVIQMPSQTDARSDTSPLPASWKLLE